VSTTPVWDDQPRPPTPRLDHDLTTDVCVIGLGGSGLTALHVLRDHDVRAIGVDAGLIAAGAAGRNGGFLLAGLARPHHRVVEQLGRETAGRLHQLTLDEIDRITKTTPDAVRRTGSLRIEDEAAGRADCVRQREALLANGFAVLDYDGPEGRGLLLSDDGVLQPVRRCVELAAGLEVFENSPVMAIESNRVETPGGTIRCEQVLVTVDGRLEQLLPELSGRVRTVRLQMLATAPTAVLTSRAVYLRDGYDYYQQLPDGRLAAGGCRDLAALQEETSDAEPTAPVQQGIERFLRERLRVTAPVTHRWAASVGYTDDGLPYVGEVRPGVWAAGGYCGTGNVVGALCARAIALAAIGQDGSRYWPLLS